MFVDVFFLIQDFSKFIWTVVHTPVSADDASDTLSTVRSMQVQLATRVMFSTLVLARDRSPLSLWFPALKSLLAGSPQSCQWLCLVRVPQLFPLCLYFAAPVVTRARVCVCVYVSPGDGV